MFEGQGAVIFFCFRNLASKVCVSWALSLVECVAVWVLSLIHIFLILSMIILIFIMTALAIFIDCICILGKRALISIMIFFFCIIGCVLIYVQIPMNSNLNWLKYIDPAYCLNAGDIIGKYVNINICLLYTSRCV